jgi:hypothetical protein
MAGIKVVAALVRCAADLLLCDDIDTDHLRFNDVEECRRALPAIISQFRGASAPDQVVMGRCRFLADRTPAMTPGLAHRAKPGSRIDVAGTNGSVEPSAP